MKECPVCHTQYDDSMKFCLKDGNPLEKVPTKQNHNPARSNNTETKNGKGCLKKAIITVVAIVIALMALYNHLNNAATYLRTEPSDIKVSKGGCYCNIDIDYDGYVWSIKHLPEWASCDEYDKSFGLTILPNTTGHNREGSVTVQSGKLLAQVMIRQNAFATSIHASESSLSFGLSGGSHEEAIQCDGCNWIVEYPDWLQVTVDRADGFTVSCPVNNGDYRYGTIVVKEDNVRTIINVAQSGKCYNCHGNQTISCTACFGQGSIGYGYFSSSCFSCGGSGSLRCGVCNGVGYKE